MSEIDVSKCDYYFQGRCGVSKNINYSIGCYANDCYYKQLQQLKAENEELKETINKLGVEHENYDNLIYWQMKEQQDKLKAENEELKENYRLSCLKCKFKNAFMILDEIEDIIEECNANSGCYDTCKYYDLCNCDTDSFILNIIKQAKEK